jgi:uncharacterized protein YndB with AHSA1/START domain
MTRIAGEVTVAAPVEEVFDLVADERNEPRYNPRITRVEMLTPEPVGAGSRFRAVPRSVGPKGEMLLEIVAYDRPRRLHNVVRSTYLSVAGDLTFTPHDGGTRLRWDWDLQLSGRLRLLSPVLRLVGPAWERRNWVGLKAYLETRR